MQRQEIDRAMSSGDLDPDDLEEEEDTQHGKYLTFALGEEEYGIPIRSVTEIIGIQRITHVPDMPPHIRGIINLRGQVIPVMDVRVRFGLPPQTYHERTCVVVVDVAGTAVGLIVDAVSEVLGIPEGDVMPAPQVKRSDAARYIEGIGKVGEAVKILLDVERLLYEDLGRLGAAETAEVAR